LVAVAVVLTATVQSNRMLSMARAAPSHSQVGLLAFEAATRADFSFSSSASELIELVAVAVALTSTVKSNRMLSMAVAEPLVEGSVNRKLC